jgi:signal transduction histidine kinase
VARPEAEPAAAAPGRAELAVAEGRRAAVAISRTGIGIVLVIAAGGVFLQTTGALGAARDVLLALIAAVVVLAVIFAPWIVRLVRSLTEERAERIRSQERAEVAAHLHDSVLQTLALMQKRAEDPREVATLARRQERELRAWLNAGSRREAGASLAAALEATVAEIEDAHGVPVEVVAVGDRRLDERAEALVAATREAVLNAVKFAPDAAISVYAEVRGDRAEVFVRDRGPGFDLHAIPPDRRGLRESVLGRMERHGGRAAVHTRPGEGTEVELVMSA